MVALTSSNYCSICYSDRCPGSNVYLLFLPSAWCFKSLFHRRTFRTHTCVICCLGPVYMYVFTDETWSEVNIVRDVESFRGTNPAAVE